MKKMSTSGAFCIVPRALIERISLAGLNACHLGLLTFLIDRADDLGVSFWSLKKIGAQLGCSKSTVSRMLSDLHRTGFVAKKPRPRRDGANSVLEICVIGHAEFRSGRTVTSPNEEAAEISNQSSAGSHSPTDAPQAETPCPAKKATPFAASVVSRMKRAVSETQQPVPPTERHGNENQANKTQEKNTPSSLPEREGTNFPSVPGWNEEKEKNWMSYFGSRTGYHDRPTSMPPIALLDAAIEHYDHHKVAQEERKKRQMGAWTEMLTSLGVPVTAEHARELASVTARLDKVDLHEFLGKLRRDWKSYWRCPPLPEHVEERLCAHKIPQADGARMSELMMRALVAKNIKQEQSQLRLTQKEAA